MKPLSSKDPKTIGGFTLVGRLGAGGMGVVYLASRKSESAALKVIRESLIDDEAEATRFTREVATLEKIDSPNVARIVDAGVDNGRAWFAAEFVNGPNLSERIDDKGPITGKDWWDLARGLLRGLADIHSIGVIHRDIKPANLILAESGPKLIDFGIAHVSDVTSVTATGLVAGSPAWFSPEQIEGLELTVATDVFSAGSVLTFAATGSSPWGGETTMTKASVFKILTSEPTLDGLEPAQQALLRYMLEKDASIRPSAESLLKNLEKISEGQQVEVEASKASSRPTSKDNTTVVSRSMLDTASQAAGVKAKLPYRSEAPPSSDSSKGKKRNLLAAGAVVVAATLAVIFVASNASGSGKVSVSKSEVENNPAVGEYSLRLSSGSIEPVTLSLSEKESFTRVFTWKTGEPLRVSFTPPFSEDEGYEGTILPSELSLSGFTSGRELFVHVSLEETSTLLSFRTGENRVANEVYAIRLARENEKLRLGECISETERTLEAEVAPFKNLGDLYDASLEEARLVFDGYSRLLYTTWSSRIGNLISLMQSNLAGAQSSSGQLSGAAESYVQPILSAHSALLEAWSAQRSSAQQGAQSGRDDAAPNWDANWSQIGSAEIRLRTETGRGISTHAASVCSEIIQ